MSEIYFVVGWGLGFVCGTAFCYFTLARPLMKRKEESGDADGW